jgi:thioredoxin 1
MGNAVELNVGNWEKEVSQSETLTVVYFWHQQCPWCFRLTPIFDNVAREYAGKVKFAKLNILESSANQKVATNMGVMSTPTLMFLCNGRPIRQMIGLMSQEELSKTLDDMLRRYKICIKQSTDLRNYIA